MKPARVEIAAPGGLRTHVVRAPFAVEPESKRASKIEAQEFQLRDELDVLQEGTKARNREQKRQLDAIEERGRHWEAKLRVEAEEQVEVHDELRKFFEETLKNTMEAERQNLRDTMDRFHNDLIPPQQDRMEDNEKMVEVFVSETVPAVVDRQSGIVGRKLQKAHETFDIENAKVMKREQKIISRFHTHVQRTAQAFEDERATRVSKLLLLREEMADNERRDDREEEKHMREVIDEVIQIRQQIKAEVVSREKEDNTLLDTMLYAQQRLQEAILRSFGASAEDGS